MGIAICISVYKDKNSMLALIWPHLI